jgi:hypothetical protein
MGSFFVFGELKMGGLEEDEGLEEDDDGSTIVEDDKRTIVFVGLWVGLVE